MGYRIADTFDSVRQMAQAAGARYPELVAAQWALESGHGKYLSGTNNPFGIKDPGGTVKTTQEVVNGKTVTTQAGFKNFASTQDAVNELVGRWYKDYKGYKGVNNAPDLASAAQMLKAQGYATDPAYASKLLKVAGAGGGGSQPAAPTPQPAGPGLPAVAPMADPAGPAAASASAETAVAAAGLEAARLEAAGLTGLSDPAGARLAAALTADLASGAKAAGTGATDDGLDLVTTLAGGEQGQAVAQSGRKAGGFNVIEYLTGDKSHSGYRADHGGGNYHEHLAFGSKAERDAAMAKLKANGIQIGSVNDGKHAEGSYHYKDLAFDVPAAQVPVGQEQELSRRVRAILGIG